jgi:hypothetical protein
MHKSLGNAIEPDQIIKHHGAEILRLWTASVEFNEDVRLSETILTRLVDAYRKLRNTFRYLLGNLHDFDPATDAVPAPSWPRSTSGFCCAPKTWWPAAAVVRELRVPQGLSRGLRLRHGGPERGVFRRAEGPAVHLGTKWGGAAQRADRALPAAGRAGAAAGAADELHAEEVWTHMGRTGSVHMALLPGAGRTDGGLGDAARAMRRTTGTASWKCATTVLKSLEAARNEKLIGAPLEACVRALGRRRSIPAARAIRPRTAGAVHRFASGSSIAPTEGECRDGGARGRPRSASAAGSTLPTSASTPVSPTVCAMPLRDVARAGGRCRDARDG